MTDYLLYLLFRKSRWIKNEYIQEPHSLPPSVYEDQDQRLFSFHIPQTFVPLTSEQLCHYLLHFWQEIQPFYQNCLVQNTHHPAVTRGESEKLFLGGMILMIGDEFEATSHTIRLILHDEKNPEKGEVLFCPPSDLETSTLFTICDKDNQNTSSARFVNFEMATHLHDFKDRELSFQWLLKFDHHRVYLMPTQGGEHPLLKVYGLFRGEKATWEDRLADFLVYHQHAVLPVLMSWSLMYQWQERDFYVRTVHWINVLKNKSHVFYQEEHSTSPGILQGDLQKLEDLVMKTKDLLAAVERTFDMANVDTLMHKMYKIQGEAKAGQWIINWYWQQEIRVQLLQACFPNIPSQPTYPALLKSSFQYRYEMRNLKDSLEEQLRHLEGHRLFLTLKLKKQENFIKEKFIAVGYSIILSLAVMMIITAGLKGLFQEYTECCCVNCWYLRLISTVLENPLIYLFFILAALVPIFQQEWKFYREKILSRRNKENNDDYSSL